jgi:hypothetical protein
MTAWLMTSAAAMTMSSRASWTGRRRAMASTHPAMVSRHGAGHGITLVVTLELAGIPSGQGGLPGAGRWRWLSAPDVVEAPDDGKSPNRRDRSPGGWLSHWAVAVETSQNHSGDRGSGAPCVDGNLRCDSVADGSGKIARSGRGQAH